MNHSFFFHEVWPLFLWLHISKKQKHKNHLSAIIAPMLKIVYAENSEQFYLMQKTDFMNAISKFEYTVNMMCREQILLT